MSVQEHSLKFIKLSKYASSLVTNSRDKMSHFVTGVFNDLVEECHATMLHNDMDLSHLLVHSQQVEESWLMRKNRELKRARMMMKELFRVSVKSRQTQVL